MPITTAFRPQVFLKNLIFFSNSSNTAINVDSSSLNGIDFTSNDKQANSDLYHICVRESSFITTMIGCLTLMSDFIENPTLISTLVPRQPYSTIEGHLGFVVVRRTCRGLFPTLHCLLSPHRYLLMTPEFHVRREHDEQQNLMGLVEASTRFPSTASEAPCPLTSPNLTEWWDRGVLNTS